ncbi:MAG: polyprenyl synthetase family protein [Myxococcales bacterium]|nr:polyprenyl synthetase family protein [Myxococcales bacterium]
MASTFAVAAAPVQAQAWITRCADRVEQVLARHLQPPSTDHGRLIEAMRYAALGPGKRLRPAMLMASCVDLGGNLAQADAAAAAIECLHAYTLVHDDLPAMDDDVERRGRPTLHIAFDEATAILAGDGLLTEAFGLLATLPTRAGEAIATLARLSGPGHLLAGQAIDLVAQRAQLPISPDALQSMHEKKTGALFAAAAALGGICADAAPATCARLEAFGMAFGLAFQYADDLDDGEHTHLAELARREMKRHAELAWGHAQAVAPGGQLAAMAAWARALE